VRIIRRVLSDKYVVFAIRLVLGVVFIYASADKIAHPGAFAESIYNYRMLPHWSINVMAIVMPWLELICGALIIAGVFLRGSALMIGVMLGVFIIAISAALLRGLDISCGCFTVEGGHAVAVDLLVRDVLMFAGAMVVMFLGTSALSLKIGSRHDVGVN
jgi:putative oxidoreductase